MKPFSYIQELIAEQAVNELPGMIVEDYCTIVRHTAICHLILDQINCGEFFKIYYLDSNNKRISIYKCLDFDVQGRNYFLYEEENKMEENKYELEVLILFKFFLP